MSGDAGSDVPEQSQQPSEPSEPSEQPIPGRRPPAPPRTDQPTGAVADFEPALNDWLDPTSQRHRRSRHTQPTRARDRLRRKWRRWRRRRRKLAKTASWYRPRNIALAAMGLVIIVVIAALLSAYLTINGVRRAPMLPLDAPPTSVGTNILLLASDGAPAALGLDANTLEVEFIHISANYQAGQVIDLPRDLVIGSAGAGSTPTTVASAYQSGGVVGLVNVLQKTMRLTINHAMQTSFTGYAHVTQDLGTLQIQTDTGKQPFTGPQAQAWVAQANPPGGSIESGRRFQHWSKAMLQATLQPGVLLNPLTAWFVFRHTANNVVVDDTLDNGGLIGLVWHLRSLSPTDLHFYTVPQAGYGQLRGKTVLLSNPTAFDQISTAIRTDNSATLGLFQ